MENLQIIIDKIKEIDKALDAYEYSNRTYEEYVEDIKEGKHGTNSLRRRYLHGKYIWNTIMQDSLDKLKETVNLMYRNNDIDNKQLSILIDNLKYTEKQFKKNTDDCSIYPLQSELVIDNLLYIINYLEKYMYMKNYEERNQC